MRLRLVLAVLLAVLLAGSLPAATLQASCAHAACHAAPTHTPAPVATATPAPTASGMALVFSDDFDGTALDTTKWTATTAQMFSGYGAEHWSAANCVVSGGLLHLVARSDYSSCDVRTFGKFSLTYGRVDVWARVPAGDGLWPGAWLASDYADTTQQSRQEIDLMEDKGSDLHRTTFNVHWGVAGNSPTTGGAYADLSTDYSQAFHQYSVIWNATRLDFYVDGVMRWSFLQPSPPVAYDPMNMRLSLSICSTGLAWCPAPDNTTPWPSELQVDRVAIYH